MHTAACPPAGPQNALARSAGDRSDMVSRTSCRCENRSAVVESAGIVSPARRPSSRKWLVCSSQPSAPPPAMAMPFGESSRLTARACPRRAPASTVSEVEALTRADPAIRTASSTVSASSRMRRATACTGTPPESSSDSCERMLKCRPSPEPFTPILPGAPNSVNSLTVRPRAGVSWCSSPNGARASCQSQVWSVCGAPDAGVNTAVEHSPSAAGGAAASTSVRAPTAATTHRSIPAASAHASDSAASSGYQSRSRA